MAVIVLIGLGSLYLGTVGVFIPEHVVQKRVRAALPLTLSRLGSTVEVRQISLNTRRDGTVFVSGEGDVEAMGATGELRFSSTGRVHYDEGGVYLRDLTVESIRVLPAEKPTSETPPLATAGEVLRKAGVDQAFNSEAAVFALVRSRVAEAADRLLAETPVYDLREGPWKVRTAALAVSSVGVEQHGINAEFSIPALFWVGLKVLAVRGDHDMSSQPAQLCTHHVDSDALAEVACGHLRGRQEAMRCFRPRFPVECPERRPR